MVCSPKILLIGVSNTFLLLTVRTVHYLATARATAIVLAYTFAPWVIGDSRVRS